MSAPDRPLNWPRRPARAAVLTLTAAALAVGADACSRDARAAAPAA